MDKWENRHVLVVDDEASIRFSLAAFLEEYDFLVTTAQSAEEALTLCETTHFAVAVVDLRLPGINGDQFIIQAQERWPVMRFIIHTGSVDYQLSDVLQGLGMTKNQLFFKPLNDLHALVQGIEPLLEKA
ncbi:response regulator [Magnetococcus sp. PR-3]|uniref:response regulator n=1 Tax=Magnetococcus sp. PR-3 TaxID=3120355 RepID=UPI002FCDF546